MDLSMPTLGLFVIIVLGLITAILEFLILEFWEWLETDFSGVESAENVINAQLEKKSLLRGLKDNDREQIISVTLGNISGYTTNLIFIYLLTLG
ncbi:MAG: hypothetical protein HC796_08310 [Synechococcaceae cyanobacterium RL_1_2]|nr:hypothetical protein [Synechococcaceae cyanobacterium RL_1_2]